MIESFDLQFVAFSQMAACRLTLFPVLQRTVLWTLAQRFLRRKSQKVCHNLKVYTLHLFCCVFAVFFADVALFFAFTES